MKKPAKGKLQFNESLKNQNIYPKALFSEKASNIIKIDINEDINDSYKNNLNKVIKKIKYRTLKERKEPNLIENELKRSKFNSKKKENNIFNEFSNNSASRMQVQNLTHINKKAGLLSFSVNDTDINIFLSGNNKHKNNLRSLTQNLDNNDEIIEENEGENDYKPSLTKYNKTNNISKLQTQPGKK